MDQTVCNEYLMLVAALKDILKNRKITYKTLADLMGTSEHSIKYALTKKDGSISTLVNVCEALEITFFDLVDYSRKEHGKLNTFDPKQENYFLENPTGLRFFLDLDLVGVEKSAAYYSLEKKQINVFLSDFEKLNLLERLSGSELRVLVKPPYRYSAKISDLIAKFQLEDMLGSLRGTRQPKNNWEFTRYINGFSTLTKSQLNALVEDISELLERHVHRGQIQRMTGANKDLMQFGFFLGICKRNLQE